MIRPVRALGASIVLAATFAACSGTLVLNDARLQEEIQRGFQEQTGVSVQTVDRPDNQPIQTGATLQCTLTTAEGDPVTIRVTQTDAQGNIRWEVVTD